MTTKKKKSNAAPTPDEYLAFVQSAALQGIGLDSAALTVDRNALAEAASHHESLPVSINGQFKIISSHKDKLIVGAEFHLEQSVQSGDALQVLVSINCAFSALFNLGKPSRKDAAMRFAENEAKLIFWPYLRHFIADTTYRMAINPILVPLMTAVVAATPKAESK